MPRGACGIEMRMGGVPIRESVSYAPPRVHFYVGDFGLVENATVIGLKCHGNVATIQGIEDLTCVPASCCV